MNFFKKGKRCFYTYQIVCYQVFLITAVTSHVNCCCKIGEKCPATFVYAANVYYVITFCDEFFCVLRLSGRSQVSCDTREFEQQKQSTHVLLFFFKSLFQHMGSFLGSKNIVNMLFKCNIILLCELRDLTKNSEYTPLSVSVLIYCIII